MANECRRVLKSAKGVIAYDVMMCKASCGNMQWKLEGGKEAKSKEQEAVEYIEEKEWDMTKIITEGKQQRNKLKNNKCGQGTTSQQ